MPRRRIDNPDAAVQALTIMRERAAHLLEASPLLRYTLEFLVAHALAAWSGTEAQHDRLQDSRIAEVSKRLDSMQQLGVYKMQGAELHETKPETGGYALTKDRPHRSRHEQERPAHAAKSDVGWEHSQNPNFSEGAMGMRISGSMAIGAITCSGTMCIWRSRMARGEAVIAKKGHGAADQCEQAQSSDATWRSDAQVVQFATYCRTGHNGQ
jgi:hypothetical protein